MKQTRRAAVRGGTPYIGRYSISSARLYLEDKRKKSDDSREDEGSEPLGAVKYGPRGEIVEINESGDREPGAENRGAEHLNESLEHEKKHDHKDRHTERDESARIRIYGIGREKEAVICKHVSAVAERDHVNRDISESRKHTEHKCRHDAYDPTGKSDLGRKEGGQKVRAEKEAEKKEREELDHADKLSAEERHNERKNDGTYQHDGIYRRNSIKKAVPYRAYVRAVKNVGKEGNYCLPDHVEGELSFLYAIEKFAKA